MVEPVGSRIDVVLDPATGQLQMPNVDSLVKRRSRKAKRKVVIRLDRGLKSK